MDELPNKRVTSIKIDSELWKEVKKYAIDKGVTVGDLIEILLRKELTKSGGTRYNGREISD